MHAHQQITINFTFAWESGLAQTPLTNIFESIYANLLRTFHDILIKTLSVVLKIVKISGEIRLIKVIIEVLTNGTSKRL